MVSCAEYLRRLRTVAQKGVLEEIVQECIIKEEATLKILKEQDFLEGDIYGTNSKDTYASKDYAKYKLELNNMAGGHVDLINTGAFIDSFKLKKPKGNLYLFDATDSKKGELVNKYGIDIMGLNQKVFEKFQIEIIYHRFARAVITKAKLR